MVCKLKTGLIAPAGQPALEFLTKNFTDMETTDLKGKGFKNLDVTNVAPADLDDASNSVINRMKLEGVSFDEDGFVFNGDTNFKTKQKIGQRYGYNVVDDSEDEGLIINAMNAEYLKLLENELRFRRLL